MRLAGLDARRFFPALFDNRWTEPGSGRGTLLGSHLFSRRPRFRSLAAGTGRAPRAARKAKQGYQGHKGLQGQQDRQCFNRSCLFYP